MVAQSVGLIFLYTFSLKYFFDKMQQLKSFRRRILNNLWLLYLLYVLNKTIREDAIIKDQLILWVKIQDRLTIETTCIQRLMGTGSIDNILSQKPCDC